MRIVVALGAFAIGIWATHAHGSYRPPELRCGLVAGFGGSAPSFSPDGRRIAFVRPLYDEYAVYTADSNGLRVRRLSEPLREEPHETLWSPRGDLVALLTARSDVAVVDVATGAVRVLARATSFAGQELGGWSRDGTRLTYWRLEGTGARRRPIYGVYVLNVATGAERRVASGLRPRWSPVGDRIAYTSIEYSGDRPVSRVDGVSPDGLGAAVLVGPNTFGPYAWSPDASRIVVAHRTAGAVELRVVRPPAASAAVGGRIGNLAHEAVTWSPPGIAFTAEVGGRRVVVVVDPDTTRRTIVSRAHPLADADLKATSAGGARHVYALTRAAAPGLPPTLGLRVATMSGFDRPIAACRGTKTGERISGSRLGDLIDARRGGRDRVACGGGRDMVYADVRDSVARDCERAVRR